MTDLRYHALFPTRPADDVASALREVWRRPDLDARLAGRTATSLEYRCRASGAAFLVDVRVAEPNGHLFVSGIDDAAFRAIGYDALVGVLTSFSDALGVRLGRTFDENPIAVVYERELRDGVDCLDWYQYISRALVAWEEETLKVGPFYDVIVSRNRVIVTLAENPFRDRLAVRKAADYLGIRLRPVFTKGPDGRDVAIEWQ